MEGEVGARIAAQQLRGCDPITLEIQTGDLVDKPLGQIALANVADLFALSELDDLPATMRRRMEGYRQRLTIEISDLPNGEAFSGFVTEMMELSPERLPGSLRTVMLAEGERGSRTTQETSLVGTLEGHWADAEPMDFQIKQDETPEVIVGPAQGTRETFGRPGGKGGRGEPPAARTRKPRAKTEKVAKAKVPKPPEVAPERADWVRRVLLERLSGSSDKGLLEVVLVAGARHRAREEHSNLTPREVLLVLKALEKQGIVRHSARRWSMVGRLSW
jgi:hypothetical protein